MAPRLSPPVSASPLWPRESLPERPAGKGESGSRFPEYPVVEGVRVPAGGIRDVSAVDLLRRDNLAPKLIPAAMDACPGAWCGLRKPVYRDVTGDGRAELLVAVDDRSVGMTLFEVYRASGRSVRPILVTWGRLGLTGATYGHDLVVSSTGEDGRLTTRYRWNGRVMTASVPQDGLPAPAGEEPTPGPATPHASAAPTRPQPRTFP
ncbi:hypothetical protein ACWCP6_23610 [Streptomyces sp. NPDC002004]